MRVQVSPCLPICINSKKLLIPITLFNTFTMKNLFFFWAFFLWSSSLLSQISTCDLELLNIDWGEETITITLNDEDCSNASTPQWVPYPDSVYVVQLGFSFDGITCIIPSNTSNFYPPLGLNDTITYSYSEWSDPFNCIDSAFQYYQETCEATVSVVGPNNSINLDLISNNNYIGFNPAFDNCYGSVDVIEYTRNYTHYIYDINGNLTHITNDVNNLNLQGFFIVRNSKGTKKYFIR